MLKCHGALLAGVLLFTCTVAPVAHGQEQASLTASPKFRETIDQIRVRLAEGDLAGADNALSAMSPSSSLEKYMVASLAMEVAVKRRDLVAQRRAIARILESGGAPDSQLAHLNHIAGYLSYQTGAIDNAVVYLTRARSFGETAPQASLLLVESYVRQRKLDDAAKLLVETIGASKQKGEAVPASWYDRSISLAYARKDWMTFASMSAAKLADRGSNATEWRSAIASYMAGALPDKEAQLDLYRLQAAAGAMASERDYQGYAALAAEQGHPAEAKAIIEAAQAGGKLTKTDAVAASLMRSVRSKAVTSLASIKSLPGKAGAVPSAEKALRNADDLFANSLFAEAVPYYRVALEKGATDRDRLNTRLGISLARSGDLEGGRAILAQAGGRWGEVAAFWTAWIDARRALQAPASAAPSTASPEPAPTGQ